MVLGGVPLKLGLGTPTFIGTPRIRGRYSGKKRKKNFFALKHFLEPIYEIKKNIYSILLEGGGFLPMMWKIPDFFFFLLNPSLSPPIVGDTAMNNLHTFRTYIICIHCIPKDGKLPCMKRIGVKRSQGTPPYSRCHDCIVI